MMKKLRVDPHVELSDADTVPPKDGSASDATSCISSTGEATGSVKESDMDRESITTDQGLSSSAAGFCGYYYPGYDGSFGWLDDQGFYVAGDGTELQYPVMHSDNGSLVYFMPGIRPPYNPYLPVTMIGVNAQFVGQPSYSPSSMFQLPISSPGYIPSLLPYGELVPSTYLWNPSVFVGDGTHGNGYGGISEIPGTIPNMSSPSDTQPPPSKNLLPSDLSKLVEIRSTIPTIDLSSGHSVHNQLKPVGKHLSTFQSDFLGKGYFPFAKLPSYNHGKGAMLSLNTNDKANGKGWGSTEKPKTRSKINRFSDVGLLNEQNQGPQTINPKGSLIFGGNAAGPLATDGNGNSNSLTSVVRRNQYNLPDIPTTYDHAFFFVIKSYSEDDIHKSIKYNVWASTPNGNKRLDSAYQDAQEKIAEKGGDCPVFLFFSVNASGQFCGVAEMTGRVDFNKNMDFWQQDKWNGYFPVKWHIIKDVPNPQLRHIILENNENKPVTNSRDTQNVMFPQGIEILNIFQNYVSKTSILDDFDFYESRQKVMEEKKPQPIMPRFGHREKADELATGFQSLDVSSGKNMEGAQDGEKAKE